MKLSTAVSFLCASWLVLADAAALPPSARDATLDVSQGAGHPLARAERVRQYKRGDDDDNDDWWKHGSDDDSSDSGSGSDDGKTYTGTGTFFTPSSEGGSTGACGDFNDDDAEIVALNGEQYGDSSNDSDWCGKKVEIWVGDKSTSATITDMCPECKTGDLDLTKAVFEKLGDLDVGELDISWHVV